jgi:hypothetical protein
MPLSGFSFRELSINCHRFEDMPAMTPSRISALREVEYIIWFPHSDLHEELAARKHLDSDQDLSDKKLFDYEEVDKDDRFSDNPD